MGEDVDVERIEFWIFALEGGLDRLRPARDVELRMRRQRSHAAQDSLHPLIGFVPLAGIPGYRLIRAEHSNNHPDQLY